MNLSVLSLNHDKLKSLDYVDMCVMIDTRLNMLSHVININRLCLYYIEYIVQVWPFILKTDAIMVIYALAEKRMTRAVRMVFQGIWLKLGWRKSIDPKCGLCSDPGHSEHILFS